MPDSFDFYSNRCQQSDRMLWLPEPLFLVDLQFAFSALKIFQLIGNKDIQEMPFLKHPPNTENLWRVWEKKSQKSGLRHMVYNINGDQYKGEWSNNLKHGKGIYWWKKTNSVYQGEWKYDKRSGFGAYSILDPNKGSYVKVYSGSWKDDKKHGEGTYYYSDKEYYEGDWEGGKRSGWGRMYFHNGDFYEGGWLGDKQCGQGILFLANGNRYEGFWQEGKKHGPGKFFYLDRGQLYEGTWVNDVPKSGTIVDYEREEAPFPPTYPIPKVEVANPDEILEDARSSFFGQNK